MTLSLIWNPIPTLTLRPYLMVQRTDLVNQAAHPSTPAIQVDRRHTNTPTWYGGRSRPREDLHHREFRANPRKGATGWRWEFWNQDRRDHRRGSAGGFALRKPPVDQTDSSIFSFGASSSLPNLGATQPKFDATRPKFGSRKHSGGRRPFLGGIEIAKRCSRPR